MICQENLIQIITIIQSEYRYSSLIDTGDFRKPTLSLKMSLLCFWLSFWEFFLISMPCFSSFPSNRPDRGTSCFTGVTTRKSKMQKTLGAQQWLTFPPTGYLSVHHKICFCPCRPVRRHEVGSAAFKQGTGQMFQFPTCPTGSADAKGANACSVLLPPSAPSASSHFELVTLEPSWWNRGCGAELWSESPEPSAAIAGRDLAADSPVPPSLCSRVCPGYEGWTQRSRDSPCALPGGADKGVCVYVRVRGVCFAAFSCSHHWGVI